MVEVTKANSLVQLPQPNIAKKTYGRGCQVSASMVVEKVGGNFQFVYKPTEEAKGFAPSMAMFSTSFSRHLVYPVNLRFEKKH